MKILGLDLGIGSIGWALIEADQDSNPIRILGIGSRIISLTPDESKTFETGKGESICAARTMKRTARKGYNRYQQRRALLKSILASTGMMPSGKTMLSLSPLELWKLRSDAADSNSCISLEELGRVLLHINQKRGYRHSRSEVSSKEKKLTDYVAGIEDRYAVINERNQTIGQYFYAKLRESCSITENGKELVNFRIKEEVLPRKAYLEEFNKIMEVQKKRFPNLLTDGTIESLRHAIFFQRTLKSCKHLVSLCEFETRDFQAPDGRKIKIGPKVSPRTSPLAQLCRIYEVINNIVLRNSANKRRKSTSTVPSLFDDEETAPKDARLLQYEIRPNQEERQRIFEYLQNNPTLTFTKLLALLGLKKSDGFTLTRGSESLFKGNETLIALREALEGLPDREELLTFQPEIIYESKIDKETGEIMGEYEVISDDYINQPLYRLWHLLYSISDKEELTKALEKQYGITDQSMIDRLYSIDFRQPGYSNRSSKFMRKILPQLMKGRMYSDACAVVGVNHSNSLTSDENAKRDLKTHLDSLMKGSLRQPVVEKILNQMINIVNSLLDEYGEIDEVRVELARQLRQSAAQRAETTTAISKREKENKSIIGKLEEYRIKPSRNRIQKFRMWEETGHTCMYCGATIGATEFLTGEGADIEHIIPRSLYFDDSFANRTCACRKCNVAKGANTAFDYMKSKSEKDLATYLARVDELFKNKKIGKRKHDYLLMSKEEIPTDFLNRDLGLTQYISKKAREILSEVIRDIHASSGSVTDFFRHAWGYDTILHHLNLVRYRKGGMTETTTYEHEGQLHEREQIIDWTKRLDHRHHAIDALTIALTRQGYIQRLNTLSANENDILGQEILSSGNDLKRERRLVQWAETRPHFSMEDVTKAVSEIAVSHKSGKKLTTPAKRKIRKGGKNKVVQQGLIVPRGSLHKETIYGKILMPDGEKKLKDCFKAPDLIMNHEVRQLVNARLEEFGGDLQGAIASLKKRPLILKKDREQITIKSAKCYKPVFVVRRKIGDIGPKDIDSIIDGGIRTLVAERYAETGPDQKKFQASLSEQPLRFNEYQAPIRTVRCATGLNESSMIVPRRDESGKALGYAAAGSNDHVAIYEDENGKIQTMVVTFWTAVKRKKAGLEIIIRNPADAWDQMIDLDDENLKEDLAQTLPQPQWKFLRSLRMNETYLIGLTVEEISDAKASDNKALLLSHLYRVTGVSDNYYEFRLHTDTTSIKEKSYLSAGLYERIQSYKALLANNLKRVQVDNLGRINIRYD